MNKQELASTIWSAANELRKNISASEYKNYILGFMFYKYLSDKELQFLKGKGATVDDLGQDEDDYFKNHNGYFIAKDDLFGSWLNAGQKLGAQMVSDAIERFYQNLNEKYARCFYVYNREVNKHSGVFDALDSGLSKLGENAGSRDKAVRGIVGIVAKIPAKSKEYDVLGYVYEYLIKQFSSEAKKDGAFYTPHELTQLMAKITSDRIQGKQDITVYDPCLGTAGLLLNIGEEAGKYVSRNDIHYYGQELITETSNLAKMNLFMADVPVQNMVVRNADTLEDDWPYFDENTPYKPMMVDICVANPPYSVDWNPDEHATDERFRGYGLAPAGKADYAFLLHCLYHLKPDGVMAIVLPHGVLFRGDQEAAIRRNLLLNHNIETIIGMPDHLFFSTGIPVVVMILSKNRSSSDVLFIDASQNYTKGKNQNILRSSDVERIYDAVKERKDIDHFAKLVSLSKIEENDFNLNIPRYVSAKSDEEPYDLYSVMTGDVSEKEIEKFDTFRNEFGNQIEEKIFESGDTEGYLKFRDTDIRKAVQNDDHVLAGLDAWKHDVSVFADSLWKEKIVRGMHDADSDAKTDAKTAVMAFADKYSIVDPYAVYQAFDDVWGGIDADLSRIRAEGTGILTETETLYTTKKNPKTKEYDRVPTGEDGKVIPLSLVADEYFGSLSDEAEKHLENAEQLDGEASGLWEELDEDEKADVSKDDDAGTLDAKKLAAVVKENKKKNVAGHAADAYAEILEKQNEAKAERKAAKDTEKKITEKAKQKLGELNAQEVDHLLHKKWLDPLKNAMLGVFTGAVDEYVKDLEALKKKYAGPLPEIEKKETETGIEMSQMMSRLHGSAADDAAISMLKELLK